MVDQNSTPLGKRPLGSQGLLVSTQGLGCMGMSDRYAAESTATVRRALDLGVTFFDTAEGFGPFTNEVLVGKAVAGRRDDVQLATKFAVELDDDGLSHDVNGTAEYVNRAVDRSLRHLGTDYIDLYYLERVDPEIPIEDTMDALADVFMAGKIRYIGLGDVSPEVIRRAHLIHPVTAVQSEFSLLSRGPERDGVLATCRELGIGFVPSAPLGRGAITDDRLKALADEKGVTPAQFALAWVHAHDNTTPIPGTKRPERVEQNVAAAGIKLTTADLAAVNAAFPQAQPAAHR